MLVLTILFSIPFFNHLNYLENPDSYTYSIDLLASAQTNSTSFNSTFDTFISTMKETKHPVLYVLADGVEYRDTSTDVNKLRGSEKDVVTVINEQNKDYIVIFDNRYESRLLAGLGIG